MQFDEPMRVHGPATSKTALRSAAVPAIVCALVGGCNQVGPPVARPAAGASQGPPAVAAPRSQESDRAIVERLSEARCTRETWCSNVGDGRTYASRDTCLAAMRDRIGHDINARSCPRGIDGVELERCALAIQREECGHPADTAGRIEQCRTGILCI